MARSTVPVICPQCEAQLEVRVEVQEIRGDIELALSDCEGGFAQRVRHIGTLNSHPEKLLIVESIDRATPRNRQV